MPDEKTKKPRKATGTIELGHLIKLANAGKPRALKMLRRAMDRHPEIWQQAGDLGKIAEHQLVTTILQTNRFGQEAIKRKLADLRAELEGPSPTALVRLCVDRVVACWLQVQHADLLAGGCADKATPEARSIAKRQDTANRRFIASLKSLATLRRLLPTTEADETEAQVRVYPPAKSRKARTA